MAAYSYTTAIIIFRAENSKTKCLAQPPTFEFVRLLLILLFSHVLILWHIIIKIFKAMVFVEGSMAVLGTSTEVSKLTVEIMEVFTGASGTITGAMPIINNSI